MSERIRVRRVRTMSNVAFLERYGRAGRVCLVGGDTPIDRGIRIAQRRLTPDGRPSVWSHAFVFQGERIDGRLWVLESDIDIQRGQVRNGVQENRIDKYADEKAFPNLAVLDFGIGEREERRVVSAGLDFISRATRYAFGGILNTYWAMLRKRLDRDKEKEKDEVYCSAFVRTLLQHVGVDLAPGVAVRHTTPEHIAQTPVRHARYELIRQT